MDGLETTRFFNQKRESEQHTNTAATLNLWDVPTSFRLFVKSGSYFVPFKRGGLTPCITFPIDACNVTSHNMLLPVIQTLLKVLCIIRPIKDKKLYSFGTRSHLSGSPCPIYHLEKIYRATERKGGVTRSWQ